MHFLFQLLEAFEIILCGDDVYLKFLASHSIDREGSEADGRTLLDQRRHFRIISDCTAYNVFLIESTHGLQDITNEVLISL